MRINEKKSCCLRTGPTFKVTCAQITTSDGYSLPWVDQIRYLGIYLTTGRQVRCSVSEAKCSFFDPLMPFSVKSGGNPSTS